MMTEQRVTTEAPPADRADHALLMGAAAGDREAARALLDQTASIVFGFIYARVGGRNDDAEDLTQATYLEALRSARGFRGESALATWLCTIARRQIARHYEAERRRARLESKLRLVSAADAEDELGEDALADADATIAALGRLTPLHRQVLVLKYLDGLTVEEIAGELRRTRVQVQSLLQRARAGLKLALEAADG